MKKRFLPGDSHGDGVNYHSIPADTYAGSLLAPSSRGRQLVRGWWCKTIVSIHVCTKKRFDMIKD